MRELSEQTYVELRKLVYTPLYDCHSDLLATTGSADGGDFLEVIAIRSSGETVILDKSEKKSWPYKLLNTRNWRSLVTVSLLRSELGQNRL